MIPGAANQPKPEATRREANPSPARPLPPSPRSAGILGNLLRKWRGPRCCVDKQEKEWIEQRLLWLQDQFGSTPLRQPTLTPRSELLPKSWQASEEDGSQLVRSLCPFMGVDPAQIEVFYYSEQENPLRKHIPVGEWSHSGPAGLFMSKENANVYQLGIDAAGLLRPNVLVATICHELAHVRLLGEGRLGGNIPDMEPVTDLLTIYFGAGIFTANAAIQFEQWSDGKYSGWRIGRSGYLPEHIIAYALAGYTWMRGEQSPPWRKHLRENIVPYFIEDLYYLFQTRKTALSRDKFIQGEFFDGFR